MTYIQDEITKAKELNDRDNCEILFIEDYELDYEKFYAQTRLYSMWFKKCRYRRYENVRFCIPTSRPDME